MTQPIYFTYMYSSDATNTTDAATSGDGYTAYAEANLGGTVKKIYQNAEVQTDGASNLQLVVAPSLCDTEGTSAMPGATTTYSDCTN